MTLPPPQIVRQPRSHEPTSTPAHQGCGVPLPTRPASGDAVLGIGPFQLHDDDVRVALRGELHAASSPELTATLALLGDGAPGIVTPFSRGTVQLDMSGLTFLDTAGMTTFDDARQALIKAGWRLCLTRPQPAVLMLLDLAVSAGWLPCDVACADIDRWGQQTATRLTATPWLSLTTGRSPEAASIDVSGCDGSVDLTPVQR